MVTGREVDITLILRRDYWMESAACPRYYPSMSMFGHGNDPPPLYVPDLTKPAGAAIDADGKVTCIR